MIFELALALGASSAAFGFLAALRRRRIRGEAEPSELAKALSAARGVDLGLVSGDVLMIPGEELSLGGCVSLDEGGEVLRAFCLVGAARDRWLVQLDANGRDLALTTETTEIGDGPVPSVLPLGGRTLTLEKRGVARVIARGEGVPAIDGARAPFVILAERGGFVAVVIDAPGARLALRGERLDSRVVDRLGGGDRSR